MQEIITEKKNYRYHADVVAVQKNLSDLLLRIVSIHKFLAKRIIAMIDIDTLLTIQ